MAVGTYALVSMTEAQNHLDITPTTDTVKIERLIDRATASIESMLNRQVLSRSYTEWVNVNGERILLRQCPVTAVSSVAWGMQSVMTVSSNTSTDIRATVDVGSTNVVLTRTDSSGTTTTSTLAIATYPTTTLLVAAIDALTGWDATLTKNVLTSELYRTSGADALQASLQLYYPDVKSQAIIIREDAGIIRPIAGGMGRRVISSDFDLALVTYTAGWTSVPNDIKQAALQLISMWYRSADSDPGVASESIGDYSYTAKDASDAEMDVFKSINHYRKLPS